MYICTTVKWFSIGLDNEMKLFAHTLNVFLQIQILCYDPSISDTCILKHNGSIYGVLHLVDSPGFIEVFVADDEPSVITQMT